MELPSQIVVSMDELTELRKFCRWWAVGWVAASIGLGVGGVSFGMVLAEVQLVRAERGRMEDMAELIQETAELQTKETQKFMEAWQLQQNTTELLIGWGAYINERADVAKLNMVMAPIPRPKRREQ